jgi:transcriptional regulator with XRE-family HTH domain
MKRHTEFKYSGIGKRLKKIRNHFELTQEEIAEKLGISTDTYLRNERNHHNPGNRTLHLLFKEFNISLNWLLMGHGEMFRDDQIEYEQIKQFITNSPPELIDFIQAMSQVPLLYHEQMAQFQKFMMNNKELFASLPQQATLTHNGGKPSLKN